MGSWRHLRVILGGLKAVLSLGGGLGGKGGWGRKEKEAVHKASSRACSKELHRIFLVIIL